MTDTPGTHREMLDLLPWYVNGTLPEHHRARLEAHFRECLPCHAALREERKLHGLVRDQDDLPLGPQHGLSALLDRIDRGQRRPRPGAMLPPWVGYGLAAGVGGGIVWLSLAVLPVGGTGEGEYATLSATPAAAPVQSVTAQPATAQSATAQIDVVFAATPNAAELEAFGREIGAALAGGPSEIGRYTFALDRTAADIQPLLESLRRDPRIRFAGRSYADTGGGGTVTESPGEAR